MIHELSRPDFRYFLLKNVATCHARAGGGRQGSATGSKILLICADVFANNLSIYLFDGLPDRRLVLSL